MFRLLLLTLVPLFLLASSAFPGTIIVGPPDDPTEIEDTTGQSSLPPAFQPRAQLPGPPGATTSIDSLILSGLDCSGFPHICLYVDALDEMGIPIPDLTADSFCLFQDGVQIDSFTVEQLSLDSCVTSVCLVVDVSGSMDEDDRLDSAKAAMHRFVNNMDSFDRVAIVSFSNCVNTVIGFTSNQSALHSAINGLSAGGFTACFDGIYRGVDLTSSELGSKAVIAFTDGLDNRSYACYPPPDGVIFGDPYTDDSTLIINLANGASIPIYTFNLGPITNTYYNPEALQAFADGTGGFWTHAPTGAEIDSVYNYIKERLCSRYYVCYESVDTIQNGDWHTSSICYYDDGSCSACDSSECQEMDAPNIDRTPPTIALGDSCQPYTEDIEICAYVSDLDTPGSGLTVNLFYRTQAGSYTSVGMSLTGPGDTTFCATIPASALNCQGYLEFYLTASDGQATVSKPAVNPQANPYYVELCPNHPPVADAGPDSTVSQCTTSQICWDWTASDPDSNIATVELVSSPGSLVGNQICFTPSGTLDYEFVLRATDSCGLVDEDTVVIYYSVNTAPVANAGPDSNLFLCSAQSVCWPAGCTDAEGNLESCQLLSPAGTFDGSQICFTPDTAGVYEFVMQALDSCGQMDTDTSYVTVALNSVPVCTVPDDTTIAQCIGEEVCLPYGATDADNNLDLCEIISGQGSLSGGNWCYTPSSSQTVNVTIRCTDSCGATCESSFSVEIILNSPPTVTLGPDSAVFLCAPQEVCVSFAGADADVGQPVTYTVLSDSGAVDLGDSTVCFTPSAAGVYELVLQIEDSCGVKDQDTVQVTVTTNAPPVADAGADQSLFLCNAGDSVCWSASCSDPNGNLSTCQLISGPGTYDGSEICFAPASAGTYDFVLEAIDACGASDVDSVQITIELNAAPTVAFGADSAVFLCTPEPVCVAYQPGDADGLAGLTEFLVSGAGAIDTATNEVCFTPTVAGQYEIVVQVIDSCGAMDRDTIVVDVDFGVSAAITCPASAFDLFLCGTDSVVQGVTVTPSSAVVTASYGEYSGGAVRFLADTAGTYTIQLIATEACGADSCDLTFNVTFNAPPVANAGSDVSLFKCSSTQICRPASCSDPDGNLTNCELVSGPGTYNGSNICFTPTADGAYTFILKATDACGLEDQDTVIVTVTLNDPPAITMQADSSVFLCSPGPICVSYSVSDPNGPAGLIETLVSGSGSIDTAANTVCFTPTTDGSYKIVVAVQDSCGEVSQDTVDVDVSFGEVATIDCPTDTVSAFLCAADSICTLLDIQPSSATVSVSYGTYAGGELCILADTTGIYVVEVIADEECGADTCEVVFDVEIGAQAEISCPPSATRFKCAPGNVCIPISVITPGATVTVSPIGQYTAGNVCFMADTSGHYVLDIVASTVCGSDSCEIVIDVDINSPPVAVDPAGPVDTFLCAPDQICYQFASSDPDGGAQTWSRLSGNGTVTTAGLWCFNATADGSYSVTVEVTDSCGAADTTSLTYNVDLNSAPVVTLPDDASVDLCLGDDYCFLYTVSDADGNAGTEELISGTGTIDTTGNEVCFTPASAGMYEFIVRYTDSCGAVSEDTTQVTITLTDAPSIACAASSVEFLCSPDSVCRTVTVTPSSATVTVSPIGTYAAGTVCFLPDTSGHYVLTVEAQNSCGTASCELIVDVTLNAAPIADDPASPVDTFICAADQICYQFAATDADGGDLNWLRLSGNGTVTSDGLWCFTASGSGVYSVSASVTDSCGRADTLSLTYNVTINTAPTVAFGADSTVALCGGEEICVFYTVSDADGNITLEAIDDAPGGATIDTVNNSLCFTPAGPGTYSLAVRVTDSCGADDADTIQVTAAFNTAPVANAGPDLNRFLCASSQICWSAGCTDVDNNIDSCYVSSGDATFNGGDICFTPDTAGVYEFVLRAVDSCGAADEDTVAVTVMLNSSPVCSTPGDTTIFQCTLAQISLPVGAIDPDGNFSHCAISSGPGSIVGGQWQYTPTAAGTVVVGIQCLDSCGAFCADTFAVTVRTNTAPTADAGVDSTFFTCGSETICWPANVFDVDGNLQSVELANGFGTYNSTTHQICYTVPQADGLDKTHTFVLRATDSCGAVTEDQVVIHIDFNAPPVVDGPPDLVVLLEQLEEVCIDVDVTDEDDNLAGVTVSPSGTWSNDQLCFTPDSAGEYCFVIEATDDCGETAADTVCVTIDLDECMLVQIEKVHDAYQGLYTTVDIYLNGGSKELGGYDFLIAYDQSAIYLQKVVAGNLLVQCGWEYFQYRYGDHGNCGGCPTGLLRIVALAETNNGAYHPGCFLDGQVGTLARMTFMVSNDRALGCSYVPIRFIWNDCGDNAISSRRGDTTWIVRDVYSFELDNITDHSLPFPSFNGAPDYCLEGGGPGKPVPLRCVDYWNGGIDIICADSIDAPGDVNLNGISYEVADAVMLGNYFVHGLQAFGEDFDHQQASIAASETNGDGVPLTVADLVYLIRVVVGDASPYGKLAPAADDHWANITIVNGAVTVLDASDRIGALRVVVDGDVTPRLTSAAKDMELQFEHDGKHTNILLSSLDGSGFVSTGPVLWVGDHEMTEIEAGSYDGYVMRTEFENLPRRYELSQNYPNPFNPVTTIEFALPVAGEWELNIYNILGQTVQKYTGDDEAGYYKVDWDASDVASGVYFYRFTSGSFKATRKMMMLK